jgi:hypothetical protein
VSFLSLCGLFAGFVVVDFFAVRGLFLLAAGVLRAGMRVQYTMRE